APQADDEQGPLAVRPAVRKRLDELPAVRRAHVEASEALREPHDAPAKVAREMLDRSGELLQLWPERRVRSTCRSNDPPGEPRYHRSELVAPAERCPLSPPRLPNAHLRRARAPSGRGHPATDALAEDCPRMPGYLG